MVHYGDNSTQIMIAQLRGTVLEKQTSTVVLDVGGVGYQVAIPIETYSRIGQPGDEVMLYIHTHMRENILALFGFHNPRDKQLFEKFIQVGGIGPKLALTILSGLSSDELMIAIQTGDVTRLTRIPGVGKKTGERIVLELKNNLDILGAGDLSKDDLTATVEEDVISVLVNLGSMPEMAQKCVMKARQEGTPAEFESLFREAMKLIQG